MTDQQILEQLKRMTMFGNLQQTEVDGYLKTLRGRDYTFLVRAIDFLISNHERRYFPLPADITKAYKTILSKERGNQEYKDYSQERDTSKVYGYFIGALGSAMKCFPQDWLRLQKKIIDTNTRLGNRDTDEEQYISEMIALKNEAERLQHHSGGSRATKKCIPGAAMSGYRPPPDPEREPAEMPAPREGKLAQVDPDGLPF